jgi:site-specific DNA recombinase
LLIDKSMNLRLKNIYEEFIYAYARVSSASQDIDKQINYIKHYLKRNNIPEEKVKILKDNDISANVLSMEERPGLEKLRIAIKQGTVRKLIVYHRDRLARNFYEYVLLVKELYKYDIEVIFVANNQPPFSKDLFTEAIQGMLAQSNGLTIRSRNHEYMEQYPSTPWLGFTREGKKSKTRYLPDSKKGPQLKRFFQKAAKANTAERLIELLTEYKALFNNKRLDEILEYLNNPFYCGHIKKGDQYYKLGHVDPLIDLDTYMQVEVNLEKVMSQVVEAINVSLERSNITPICAKCKGQMKFRAGKIGNSGYYVCSNKHYRITIEVDDLNVDIEEHFKEIMPKIDFDLFKKEIRTILNRQKEKLAAKFESLEKSINKTEEDISLLSPRDSVKIKVLFYRIDKLKLEMKNVHFSLIRIDDAFSELKQLSNVVKNYLTGEFERYHLYYMYQSFIEKIEVDNDKIIYFNPFASFFKEGQEYHE